MYMLCHSACDIRTLQMQENKSCTSQNMMILVGIFWNLRCVTEVGRPKLYRVSTHVGERENPGLI